MSQYIYNFHHDSVATLVTYLVKNLPILKPNLQWQVCWLQNNNQPVIGLLPKVSWCVYPINDIKDNPYHNNSDDKTVAVTITKTYRSIQKKHFVKKSRSTLPSVRNPAKLPPHLTDLHYCKSTFAKWMTELIAYSQHQDMLATQNHRQKPTSSPSSQNKDTYQHGLMGFIGYDISAKQLSPKSDIELADQPCAFMGHYDLYLTPYDTSDCSAQITNKNTPKWQLQLGADIPVSIINKVHECLSALAQADVSLTKTAASTKTAPTVPLYLSKTWTYQDYKAAFKQTQYHLYQGDSYQINLTQRWSGSLASTAKLSLIDYLPKLYANTHAPYAGYLGLPDFELLSCSPELFLTFDKNNHDDIQIFTKPIKGTRPRGADQAQDELLKNQLITSEKDRSENVMIVDLLRNDLGKYAKTGSVQVPKLFAIESFSNVHHMVSTITATLRDEVHPLMVLFDSLPAGSITGTPKKRAVELISELEVAARGAYCGTMGYMNFDGSGQWNVLIRSLQKNSKKEVALWAGGGITVRSECTDEYQECEDKVGNLMAVLAKNKNSDS